MPFSYDLSKKKISINSAIEANVCFKGTILHSKAMDLMGFYCIIDSTMLWHWTTTIGNNPIIIQLNQSN